MTSSPSPCRSLGLHGTRQLTDTVGEYRLLTDIAIDRVSTTTENIRSLLEFEMPPENTENLLEFD